MDLCVSIPGPLIYKIHDDRYLEALFLTGQPLAFIARKQWRREVGPEGATVGY